MARGKLSVFIGSSVESLPVVRVIERRLRENHRLAVTPWTDLPLKPGTHFLASLIAASSSFDAAVLVFGPDDLIISRGKKQRVPRDNVVFELGLFMGHLDTERTIVVAPNEWEANLKVLSDIGSLNRITYPPPRLRRSMTFRQKSAILSNALRTATEKLETHLGELDLREIFRGPISIGLLTHEIIRSFAKALPRTVNTIRNIALDMEQTWPTFRDDILENESIRKVKIETMMIDGRSPQIREMSSPTVSVKTALAQERGIVAYCKTHQRELAARRIEFSCRAYSDIPVIHGFLANQRKLTISLCSVNKGKLVGAPNPYLAFEYPSQTSRDRTAMYLFKVFNAWFDFRWERSRPIWPSA